MIILDRLTEQRFDSLIAQSMIGNYADDLDAQAKVITMLKNHPKLSHKLKNHYQDKYKHKITQLRTIIQKIANIKKYYDSLSAKQIMSKDENNPTYQKFIRSYQNYPKTLNLLQKMIYILINDTNLQDMTISSTALADARNTYKKFMPEEEIKLQRLEREQEIKNKSKNKAFNIPDET